MLLAALQAVVGFYGDALARPCAELAAVPSRDFETQRQQLFAVVDAAASSVSSGALSGSQLVPAFRIQVARVRDAVRFVGLPVTEVGRCDCVALSLRLVSWVWLVRKRDELTPYVHRRSATWRGCSLSSASARPRTSTRSRPWTSCGPTWPFALCVQLLPCRLLTCRGRTRVGD